MPGLQVAELMLAQGLSTVAKHRIDDERSAHYEALMEAEQVRCIEGSSGWCLAGHLDLMLLGLSALCCSVAILRAQQAKRCLLIIRACRVALQLSQSAACQSPALQLYDLDCIRSCAVPAAIEIAGTSSSCFIVLHTQRRPCPSIQHIECEQVVQEH